jgi:hypothetical protein
MALKAQNQCRMTLEMLATFKNPPLILPKQANIARGKSDSVKRTSGGAG